MLSKRWRDREQRWIAPGALFNPKLYAVDVITDKQAKPFCVQQHYSGSYPAARLAVGLFRYTRLVGVAVFSVPMNECVIPKYTALEARQGAELGRFVLQDKVPFNAESWFLARARRALAEHKPEIEAFVSYADPLARWAGQLLVKPAHYGTIYQASNATYVGRATARTIVLAPNGQIVPPRALSKVRNQEQGHQYSARLLESLGAPPRQFGEIPADWVKRALQAPGFQRVRHPGNLTYVFGTDARLMRAMNKLHGGGLPYEKAA